MQLIIAGAWTSLPDIASSILIKKYRSLTDSQYSNIDSNTNGTESSAANLSNFTWEICSNSSMRAFATTKLIRSNIKTFIKQRTKSETIKLRNLLYKRIQWDDHRVDTQYISDWPAFPIQASPSFEFGLWNRRLPSDFDVWSYKS